MGSSYGANAVKEEDINSCQIERMRQRMEDDEIGTGERLFALSPVTACEARIEALQLM